MNQETTLETPTTNRFNLTTMEGFLKGIVETRSKGAERFSYGAKNFINDIESTFAAGQTNVTEDLLNNYLNKIYSNVQDMINHIDEMRESIFEFWDHRFPRSDEVIEPKRFSQTILKLKYKQAQSLKLTTSSFRHELGHVYTSGQNNIIQTLLKRNQLNPYLTFNDIVGDLHILMVTSWKAFRNNHLTRSKPLTLETIIEQHLKAEMGN